jgi:hypothetical protein
MAGVSRDLFPLQSGADVIDANIVERKRLGL